MKTRERAEEERDEGGEGDLQRASRYCYAPVVFVLRRGDWGLIVSRCEGENEKLSILDFLIRFLSSRMRFKRNGSYTLNR